MDGVNELEAETAATAGESAEEAGEDQGHAVSKVSSPADAACTITDADAAPQAPRGLQRAEPGIAHFSGTTPEAFSSKAHDARSTQAASRISIAPGYSMLPWDKAGGWSAGMNAGDSLDEQELTAESISATAAPALAGGASVLPPTHMQWGSMSILSAMPAPAQRGNPLEEPLRPILHDLGSADADMHASQGWLDMHGYSDVVVHVTASSPKAEALLSIAEPKGKHAEVASSVHAPGAAPQPLVDYVLGAVQQSSGLCHLGRAVSTKQAHVQVQHNELSAGAQQLHLPSLSPATPSSGSAGNAMHASISAASSSQKPVNGQDVALDRTMPSIWDMDF
jgi:hypothetical protein